jgi:hypothetical protein
VPGVVSSHLLLPDRLSRGLANNRTKLRLDVRHEVAVHRRLLPALVVVHVHRRRPVPARVARLPRSEQVRRDARLDDDGRPSALLDNVVFDFRVGGELGDRGVKVFQVGLVELGPVSTVRSGRELHCPHGPRVLRVSRASHDSHAEGTSDVFPG